MQLQLQVCSREQILTLGITSNGAVHPWGMAMLQHYEIFLWLPGVIPSSRPRWTFRRLAEIVWEGITAHVGIISGSGEQEAVHFQGAGTQALRFQIPTHIVWGRSCCHRMGWGQVGYVNPATRGCTEIWLVVSSERLRTLLPLCPYLKPHQQEGFLLHIEARIIPLWCRVHRNSSICGSCPRSALHSGVCGAQCILQHPYCCGSKHWDGVGFKRASFEERV